MKKITTSILYLHLAALLVTTTLAVPGPQEKEGAFRGSFEGTEVQETVEDGFFSVLNASGQASHLGSFVLVLELQVTADLSAATATIELIAANGDRIFGEGEGVATFIPPATLAIVEDITITGGTGRFEGATGSLVIQRFLDITTTTGVSWGSFEGAFVK